MSFNKLQKAALVVAVCGSFVTPFTASSINVALPWMSRALHLDTLLMSWVQTAYLLAAAAFLVPFGKLADIHGRKRIYLLGMAVFCLASFLCAFSNSASMLLIFRILQGIGAAMIFSTSMAIITSVFPVETRGKALGINVAAVYVGMSIGPFLGGIITEHYSWRGVFLINVPIALTTIALILRSVKSEWAEAEGEKFDFLGSAIYVFSLTILMYGISLVPKQHGYIIMGCGFLGIVGFVRWEMLQKSPVFEIRLLSESKAFALSRLAALLNYGATFSVTFLMSLYLQKVQHLSPMDAGLILVTQPTLMAILSPVAGKMSDRIEPRIVASVGMGLTAVGLILLTFLRINSGFAFIMFSLSVLGIGFALFSSPNMNAIMSSVDKQYYGLASGTVGTMRLLGQMFSMATATLVFSIILGRVANSDETIDIFMQSQRIAFIISAIMCMGGIFASLARGNIRKHIERRSG